MMTTAAMDLFTNFVSSDSDSILMQRLSHQAAHERLSDAVRRARKQRAKPLGSETRTGSARADHRQITDNLEQDALRRI